MIFKGFAPADQQALRTKQEAGRQRNGLLQVDYEVAKALAIEKGEAWALLFLVKGSGFAATENSNRPLEQELRRCVYSTEPGFPWLDWDRSPAGLEAWRVSSEWWLR